MMGEQLVLKMSELDIKLYLVDGKLKYSAAKDVITDEIKASLVEHKQEIIDFLNTSPSAAENQCDSDKSNNMKLSFSQQRLWFIDQLEGGSAQFNIRMAIKLTGLININAFKRAISSIIERHEVLRTCFASSDGNPYQIIQDKFELPLKSIDISHLNFDEQTQKVAQLASEDGNKLFDLSKDVLIRVNLLKLSAEQHIVLFNMHHIASDAWSIGILIKEFSILYNAYCQKQDNPLAPLTIQYVDYAQWQRDLLQGEVLESQLNYWKEQLKGCPPVHNLPLDKPRPVQRTHSGGTLNQVLDAALTAKVRTLCKDNDVTLYMFLQTAFSILLGRYSNEDEFVIGTATAGRMHSDVEPLIGFFVNDLVVRTDLSENISFTSLLAKNRKVILDAYAHQSIPFEMLVETLNPQRSLSYHPLYQVKLDVQNNEKGSLSLHELELEPLVQNHHTSKYDLLLTVNEADDQLFITWRYSKDLFFEDTIARILSSFNVLVENIVNASQCPIHDLSLLSAETQKTILTQWNDTKVASSLDKNIVALFEDQVAQHPDKLSVNMDGIQLNYRELNEQANQLAHFLVAQGVTANTLVGICVERSVEMLVAILGTLKAGGAYVSIDPNYGEERINFILDDSGVKIVLTQNTLMSQLTLDEHMVLPLDEEFRSIFLAPYSKENISHSASKFNPENLAYIIYTSGSTGLPKGVEVTQGGVLDYCYFAQKSYYTEALQGSLLVTSHCFDITVPSLYLPLLTGGVVDILNDVNILQSLADRISEVTSQPYLLRMTPTHAAALLDILPNGSIATEHVFVLGGESLSLDLAKKLQDKYPKSQIYNHYGPTEATVGSSIYHYTLHGQTLLDTVPIGKPMDNTQIYVMDTQSNLAAIGIIGELYIGGSGLAKGYLNQAELTSDKFIELSFGLDDAQRLYKTGDLARWLPDGNIEYIGRTDEQVKIRGFRVELGEIEHQLLQIDGINQVKVLAREDGELGKKLVAYIVLDNVITELEEETIEQQKFNIIFQYKAVLKKALLEYMIPELYVFMESLPLMASGKLNKKALPMPTESDIQRQAFIEPRNEDEFNLCAIWKDLLKLEQIGIHDNFFSLGGDSILSMQVVSRARSEGLHFGVKDIFEYQTIAELIPNISKESVIKSPQEAVSGNLMLLPIQKMFFNNKFPVPNHFNQSVLLRTPEEFKFEHLKSIMPKLFERHDALRLLFTKATGEWIGVFQPYTEKMLTQSISYFDLSNNTKAQQRSRTEELCAEMQASLDIEQGAILKAIFLDYGDSQSRLFIVIHHLVVDGVSWRVILSDIEQAWSQINRGEPIVFNLKSTSFQEWGKQVQHYAHSKILKDEREYWLQKLALSIVPLPGTLTDNTKAREKETIRIELNNIETHALLSECNDAYRTQINELLLAALQSAYQRWTGQVAMRIEMEGHGREELFKGIEVNETVGWFTSVYPIILETQVMSDIGIVIKEVKEQYRAIPLKGVGYGILKEVALDSEILALNSSQAIQTISFNYLGQFDNSVNDSMAFSMADEFHGNKISTENAISKTISINGMVYQNKLAFDITCQTQRISADQVNAFSLLFEQALKDCIEHCLLVNISKLKHTPEASLKINNRSDEMEEILI
jgi:amino acid adenylation domain-containing protein/non-ribosomal peptide synthase protein (TIGR01720 family)